ncbi:MAG: double-strand break repair protein AddB [Hyphomicrobiaceae bacterium]|nr:double-strand break repair protein AddB [Hyphomicrobiaceae bacterium]
MPTSKPEHPRGDRPAPAARVYTVDPSRPFLDSLARALLAGDLPRAGGPVPDALDLSGLTVLLPTQRAVPALANALLAASGRRALLLPVIRPVADRDEDLAILRSGLTSGRTGTGAAAAELELPPAIPDLDRLLLLTQLVMGWSAAMRSAQADETGDLGLGPNPAAGARTPAQAASMAQDLARLMDLVEREGKSLDGLAELVPAEHAVHWEETLAFLEIITKAWPAVLSERGQMSRYDRQNELILAEARRLVATPPTGPVVVAGVTGSIPATMELMRAVAALDHGAIVLPGLDIGLDDESWEVIAPSADAQPGHPEHPQFGLKRLIDGLGIAREAVRELPGRPAADHLADRIVLVNEAMRPTATTGSWHAYVRAADKTRMSAALSGLSLVEAASSADEAEAIALVMREAAEHPTRTTALVTPDRLLARRVTIRLDAWGIRVNDSAGRPYAKTVPGALVDLVVQCLDDDFAPATVMALLKHPLARLGLPARDARFAARALELAAFRTIYIGTGLPGIRAALARAKDEVAARERREGAVRRLWQEDWDRAQDLVARLDQAFTPLAALFATPSPQRLGDLTTAHLAVARAIARIPDEERAEAEDEPLFANEAGQSTRDLFEELGLSASRADTAPAIPAADYPDFFRVLSTGRNVLPRVPAHPRLFIWGPLEARLQSADTIILGSLNDGTWPAAVDPGPWLNRPMRRALGLPLPEEEIGRAGHDFTALLGAPRVILTRARKIDGVPSVPSRWLMRLLALVDGMGLRAELVTDQPWLHWARQRDAVPDIADRPSPPRPCPPLDLRPRKLSVSAIERWIANPYAIFAAHILKLSPLPMLGAEPDAAMKGAIIHAALAEFADRHPVALPDDTAGVLYDLAATILKKHESHPRIAAFWLPRFRRFAEWFAATEPARRSGLVETMAEVPGTFEIAAPAGPFLMTARADRIDLLAGGLAITDYKTGTLPTPKSVIDGLRPQLPLEAAIAVGGGFAELAGPQTVTALRYIRASGAEPPGEEATLDKIEPAALATSVLANVTRLVALYDTPSTPYSAVRRPSFRYDFDDYAHLARVAEWSAGLAESDDATDDGSPADTEA